MSFEEYTDHVKNGVVCEFLAAAWFESNGFTVSWPSDSTVEYDFIADNKTERQRVQVKKIYYDNAKKRFIGGMSTTHKTSDGSNHYKKYKADSFDICAFVCVELNAIYIVPGEYVYRRSSITFYPDNKKIYKRPFDFERFKRVLIQINE